MDERGRDVLIGALRGAAQMVFALFERLTGKRVSEDDRRQALLDLAAHPPDKSDLGSEWDEHMARLRRAEDDTRET